MLARALVLAAHGSHHNAHSSLPARRHAAAIRAAGSFDQVLAVFWKEFPALGDTAYLVDCADVTIVPFFMAEGYFSQRVVPRELGLDGPLTERDGVVYRYTAAVGAHPRLADVIARRARAALGEDGPPLAESALVVVGHGTVQNPRSKETVLEHVATLRGAGFAEVAAAFLEEPPFVADIPRLVAAETVVIVPLFVADGRHSAEDMPRDLGLTRAGDGWARPSLVGGRRLYYTSAVGNDPAMIDVILALAAGDER
jgi:sirohydrochlorin cobaltochelatase